MTRQTLPSLFSDDSTQSPFFSSLQKEIDRVFDNFRTQTPGSVAEMMNLGEGRIVPALDVSESDEAVEITAEIPGVKEEDLDVSVTNGVLTLKGEKSSDREEKEKDYHLVERRYGSFRRQIPLGFSPADDAVDATFADGVLKLKIQKPAEAVSKTQKIAIKK